MYAFSPSVPFPLSLPSCHDLGTPIGSRSEIKSTQNSMPPLFHRPWRCFLLAEHGYEHISSGFPWTSQRWTCCRSTRTRILISLIKWTRRCVIILKKDGGNTNSKLTRHWTTSFCSFARCAGLIAFWEIALRNAHSFMVANHTFGGRIPLNAIGSNCVISTCQSREFKFRNLFSTTFIIPFTFEAKPDGTLMLLRHSNMLYFSSLLRV